MMSTFEPARLTVLGSLRLDSDFIWLFLQPYMGVIPNPKMAFIFLFYEIFSQMFKIPSKITAGYQTSTSLKMQVTCLYSSCRQSAIRSQRYPDSLPSQGGVPSKKFSNFTPVYLFWYMYESNFKANLDDMGCMWNAGHVNHMNS